MCDPIEQLEKDFAKRPRWLQDAVCRLTMRGTLSVDDIKHLTALCKFEAGVPQDECEPALVFQTMPKNCLKVTDSANSVRLESIGSVKDVNALAPRRPLEFGDKSLCVVYGGNGSGKSGYVRILKQMCGARGAILPYGNVFEGAPSEPSCEVRYILNGSQKSTVHALKDGSVPDLVGVSIYDTACADIYVNGENQVTYEPALLRLLRLLVDACDAVGTRLATEIASMPSALPLIPAEYADTEAAKWYSQLSHSTNHANIAAKCSWGPDDDAALSDLTRRAKETSPIDRAKALRKTKTRTEELAARIRTDREALSDATFDSLGNARMDAEVKRRVAADDAKKVFENALDGVANESWRLLWSAARNYSEQAAYKGYSFPYVGEGARCVLCQQPLDVVGAARMTEFERFVKGSLEASATAAEAALSEAIKKVPLAPADAELAALLDLAGVDDNLLRSEVAAFYRDQSARAKIFLTTNDKSDLPPLPSVAVVEKLDALAAKLEADAMALDKDAQADQRATLKKSLAEVSARKWLSQQKTAILAEALRLSHVHLLEEAQRLTNTRWLSKTKTDLAEVVVSEALIQRFQTEITALRAAYVKVAIERTKTTKGQVFHQVKIAGAKKPAKTAEILSEGEFRIVSIAAFIADVVSKSSNATFIFDDPVSSLDQEFESATAERLVALSKDRQVIVFTHRLSMLSLIEDAAEKAKIEPSVVMLRRECWGVGEPDKTGRSQEKNPKKAINFLLNERLSKARKLLAQSGLAAYEVEAKALCSELRITLERIVEIDLLSDIVQRFRREVQTKGKIGNLAKITVADCEIIDKLMTKYSFQEHSQPLESPVTVPSPDELESDLKALAAWCDEFKKRTIPKVA